MVRDGRRRKANLDMGDNKQGIRMRTPPPPKPVGEKAPAPPETTGKVPGPVRFPTATRRKVQQEERDSLWRRATGRPQLEAAMRQRLQPYRFESNSMTLRWVVAGLAVWILAVLALTWSDRQTLRTLKELEASGISSIPPTGAGFGDLVAFSKEEGFTCATVAEILGEQSDCPTVFEIKKEFSGTQDRGNLIFAVLAVILITTAFPWGTMTQRASRNLLTLRSAQQKFQPDWIVLWVVVGTAVFLLMAPFGRAVGVGTAIGLIVLVWKVLPSFSEVFKGSDPKSALGDDTAWKRLGSVPLVAYLWMASVAVVLFFNPITVARLSPRNDMADLIGVVNKLVWSDLLLLLPAVTGILMLRDLNQRQEARRAMVGDIEVTPPRPRDPIEVELEKRIRMREERDQTKKT